MDGGLNNKFDRAMIPDNESADCLNVIFDQGSVETRGGTSLLNTASVGSFVCDGLFTRHESTGAESMVAWFGGSLWALSGTSFSTVPSGQSIFTAGQRVGAAEYEDYMFFGNGGSIPMKYKDGELTRHGVYAPGTAPVAATAATGTILTGDYQYKVTYVNSNLVESDVSDASNTITVASQNVALTSIPVAPTSFGIESRRLYRTEAGGSSFLRLATLSDNTTTTYEDGIADGDLGVAAPSDQGVPPNYKVIVYHLGRMFVIDPSDNLVKYSEIGNPYVFKALSFRRIGDATGDIPETLTVYDNAIIVGNKRSTWMIYMPDTDDSNWINVRVITQYGSKSPFCTFKYNNKVMFAATEEAGSNFVGFAAIQGNAVQPDVTLLTRSTLGSDLVSNKIGVEVEDYKDSLADGFTAIVHKERAYITAAKTGAATENNRILFFDFSIENLAKQQKFAWAPWNGISAADFTVYDDKLYYGSSEDVGQVFEMNTGLYNDNGSAIDSYYWTKEFSGKKGQENWVKDFRWLNLFYELSGAWFMNYMVRIDSDKGTGSTNQLDLDPGGSLWGEMRWKDDPWDAGTQEYENKISIGTFRGKRIQFQFNNQNTVGQKFKVLGLNLTYNLRGRR
jgi:hypothetical protein